MNLGEKNVGSKPCWHDHRVSRVKECKKKVHWAVLEFLKIMIELILELIVNLHIYNLP